jgi:hypothetical protein
VAVVPQGLVYPELFELSRRPPAVLALEFGDAAARAKTLDHLIGHVVEIWVHVISVRDVSVRHRAWSGVTPRARSRAAEVASKIPSMSRNRDGWSIERRLGAAGVLDVSHQHDGERVGAFIEPDESGRRVATCARCNAVLPIEDDD